MAHPKEGKGQTYTCRQMTTIDKVVARSTHHPAVDLLQRRSLQIPSVWPLQYHIKHQTQNRSRFRSRSRDKTRKEKEKQRKKELRGGDHRSPPLRKKKLSLLFLFWQRICREKAEPLSLLFFFTGRFRFPFLLLVTWLWCFQKKNLYCCCFVCFKKKYTNQQQLFQD